MKYSLTQFYALSRSLRCRFTGLVSSLIIILAPLTCSVAWAENNIIVKRIEVKRIERILVLGDSLSAAYRLPQEQGWVALLQQKLTEQQYSIVIKNASVSGATTAAGLQRLPRHLNQFQPDLVVLELGANDGLQGKPLSYIQRKLAELIELSQHANAQVLLLGNRLPPNMGTRYTEPFFDQFLQLSQRYNTHYVPFMLEGVAGNDTLMMQDGLHPNTMGQKAILSLLWPSFEAILHQPKKSSSTRK